MEEKRNKISQQAKKERSRRKKMERINKTMLKKIKSAANSQEQN